MEPGLLKSADWPILIDLYFFLGGLAGGAFVIATTAALLDGARSRDVVRAGYGVALLAVLPCPILLILDLGTPSRFLNMLLVSKPSLEIGMQAMTAGSLHVKPYSPMSVGAWGLLLFSACAFVCAAEVWSAGRGRAWPLARTVAGVVGGAAGFFLAAYPGVLLGATAQPLFVNAHGLGALFLAVGAATGGAAIILVLRWLRVPAGSDLVSRVMRVTSVAIVMQIVVLALCIVSIRSAGSVRADAALAQLLTGPFSVVFWGGAVFLGMVLPLLLRSGVVGRRAAGLPALHATLVLAGGFLVKFVLLQAGQADVVVSALR